MAQQLSEAVAAAMKRLGLNKRRYAMLCGISRPTLYGILAGGAARTDTIAKLARRGDVRGVGPLIENMDGVA